jgi:hypothetical protein
MLGGNVSRLVQPSQVLVKVVPELTKMNGKLVKLLQFFQVRSKTVAELRSKAPKLVRLSQPSHVCTNSVASRNWLYRYSVEIVAIEEQLAQV